jgi:hypothetical protein
MTDRKQKRSADVSTNAAQAPRPHHVADEPVAEADALDSAVQSPTTRTGLPVEEQVRKEWDPKKDGGLPTSHRPSE